ncbi:glycosyltransferase, partial [Clostridium butyricum]
MVSIIIPVYNVEQYIGECLESILNQRYKDYELIIIDDGSTDKSLDIIYNYKNKFKNILILKQENKGVSEARNLAMNYVNGKYVLYIDSDDFLDENMLEILVARSEKFNADITICEYYFYYSENSNKNRIQKYDVDEERVYEKDEVIKYMLEDKLQGQLWHKLFKTDLLKATNFTFESGRYIQDIFPVFKAISNCNRIVFAKKPLYYYRQRYTSTVYKKDMKIADDFFFASKSIMNYIKSNNGECKVYPSPFDVVLVDENENSNDSKNIVQPDISVICDKNKLTDKGCTGSPDMIIEIISPFNPSND